MSELAPGGWSIKLLDKNLDILSGFPFKSKEFTDDRSKIGLIRIRDLVKQNIVTHYEGEYDEQYIVKRGDILIGMDGDFNIVKWRSVNSLLNQRICKVNAKAGSKFDSDFIYHLLIPELQDIHNSTGATTVKHLSIKDIRGIEKPFPPLPEQQKIATILTSVDNVIEKTEAQINKLQDLKKGMMQELLSPQEGSRQAKAFGHTEFKDSPLGRISKGWEVKPIKELCTNVVDCVNKTAPIVDYQTPYKMIRTTNVRNGRIDTDNVRYVTKETYETWTRRLTPMDGDLIFTREAPIGESGILKKSAGIFLGQRTMMYRSVPNITNIHFLMYSLYSQYCQQQLEDFSGGSTVAHMRVPDCEKILIKTPCLEEQNRIANILISTDSKIELLIKKKDRYCNNKKALMQDLLTGKVRVKINEPEKEAI